MNHRLTFIALIFALFLVQGCVAPGSAIGNLKLQGSLVSSSDEPLSNKEIEFMLPDAIKHLYFEAECEFGHITQCWPGRCEPEKIGRLS